MAKDGCHLTMSCSLNRIRSTGDLGENERAFCLTLGCLKVQMEEVAGMMQLLALHVDFADTRARSVGAPWRVHMGVGFVSYTMMMEDCGFVFLLLWYR